MIVLLTYDPCSNLERQTAISTVISSFLAPNALHYLIADEIFTSQTVPPSIRRCPLKSCGGKTPGIELDESAA